MHGAGRANIFWQELICYGLSIKTMELCKIIWKNQAKKAFLISFKHQEEFYANAPEKHWSIRLRIS